MSNPEPAYQGDDPYVFVCYAHDDAALVYPEITRLHESGFRVWYDEGVSPGSRPVPCVERSRTRIAVLLRLFVGLFGFAFLAASASSANRSADDVSLPAGHGYVLVRISMTHRFEIDERDRLVFKNYPAGETFSVRIKTPYSAGLNAYLSLISVAKGYYFCDQYVPSYSMPKPCLSADDIFEVKPGVVNYVGDWDVTEHLRWTRTAEFPDMDVTYDMATIEKSKAHFPERLGKYEVFVSYKGRKAISLNDLVELLKQDSGSDEE